VSENSKIEWTHHTFNPWWGCIEVSPACDNCYARTFAKRTGHNVWGSAGETPRRFFAAKHWAEPLKWSHKAAETGERHRVFCASMADVFEQNEALDEERWRLWSLIVATPHLDWLLLTKRPQNIRRMVPPDWLHTPQPNVWYGTTVENQHYAEVRIPQLLRVPAVVKFLSMEPLLGPVNLRDVLVRDPIRDEDVCIDALTGDWAPDGDPPVRGTINWIITGGESGPKYRPADPDWYRSLRDQCVASGVAFHFKQWSGLNPKALGRELDGREWNQYPDTRVAMR
jgi:protein gp37